jgi:hypothetical protein
MVGYQPNGRLGILPRSGDGAEMIDPSLRDQLILSVVDKFLLAGILVLATWWLNKRLEAFKITQGRASDLEKLRNQKRMDLLETELSKFYWPVYLGLQKDNAVWETILQRQSGDSVKAAVGKQIESGFILPNHIAICDAIETNIHLAAPDKEMMTEVLKYLRHIAVYRSLRETGNLSIDPLDVNVPWPATFFPVIERATIEKQAEFDSLLKGPTPRT